MLLRPAITFAFIVSIGLGTIQSALADTSPPTAPLNLRAQAVAGTEIVLNWEPALDDQQVLSYEVRRNGVLISSPETTFFTDTDVLADSYYDYAVAASDGINLSKESRFRLRTRSEDIETDSQKPSASVAEGVLPEQLTSNRIPAVFPPAGWQLVFSDEFDGNGNIDVTSAARNWRFETMDDGLHRAGNTGLDANGNMTNQFNSVKGKRWSAWYNQLNNQTAYRENGRLVIRGVDSGLADPTRKTDYMDNGVVTTYGSSKLYTAWLDTFSRVYDNSVMDHVVDPASPVKAFKYGYFEALVSFENIKTPGFRVSMWLMPAASDQQYQNLVMSQAYDPNGDNGVEIDIFEYEWTTQANANNIQLALIGGAAGNAHFNLDTGDLATPINLEQGFHTIGLLWLPDRIEWILNGEVVFVVTDTDLIPDVFSYPIISREMNSGVKRVNLDNLDDTDVTEQLPYIRRDVGLFANNIWEFRERLATDKALIDYYRIWQP